MKLGTNITKVDFLAVREAREAMIWSTTGLKERIFDSSGFSDDKGFSFCAWCAPARKAGDGVGGVGV